MGPSAAMAEAASMQMIWIEPAGNEGSPGNLQPQDDYGTVEGQGGVEDADF